MNDKMDDIDTTEEVIMLDESEISDVEDIQQKRERLIAVCTEQKFGALS